MFLFIGNSIKSYSEIPFVWQNDTLSSNFVNLNDKLFMVLNRDYNGLNAGTYVNVDVNTGEINENLFLPKFESIAYSRNENSDIIIGKENRLFKLDNNSFQIIEEIILPKFKEDDDPSTVGISIKSAFNNISNNRYLLLHISLFNLEKSIGVLKTVVYDYNENKILREFITSSRDKEPFIYLESSRFEFSKDGTKFIRFFTHNSINDDLGKLEIYSFPDFELLDELYSSERVGQAEYSEIKFFPTNNKIILRKDSIYHYYDEKLRKNRIKNVRLPNFDIYNLSTLEIEEKLVRPMWFIKSNSNYTNTSPNIFSDNILIFNKSENEIYENCFYDISKKNNFYLDIFDGLIVINFKIPKTNYYYTTFYNNEVDEIGLFDFSGVISNIETGINNSQITIFPNPSNNSIDLLNQSENHFNELLIYNSNGKLISSKNINLLPQMTINLDISYLANGVYLLNLANNTTTVLFKFIKE
jgi:hypothetical protein